MTLCHRSASTTIEMRRRAIEFFRKGVAAAEPGSAVAAALGQRTNDIDAARRVIIIAFGKAACAMTNGALPLVRSKLSKAVAVTNPENVMAIDGVHVIAAGHPIPDSGSLDGGLAAESLARSAGPGDLVLVLVSGGGSALLCAPSAGITLADKIELNNALIRSGAAIHEINAVRQHFSRLKGGRLAQLASGARLLSLIVSDVADDDVGIVASGPTASSGATVANTLDILARHGIDRRFVELLSSASAPAGERSFHHVENVVIGSNRISLETVMAGARGGGARVFKACDWLSGSVEAAARRLHRIALDHTCVTGPVAVITGGETTVQVTGTGKGGRNQELALRFALANEVEQIRRNWVFLSGGTDGRDGPTDAAGGIVDGGSLAWMRDRGFEPTALLRNNDSYAALALSGDLLITGASGTNVADLQILLMQ
jgi:hydroxypyruvate reductase